MVIMIDNVAVRGEESSQEEKRGEKAKRQSTVLELNSRRMQC